MLSPISSELVVGERRRKNLRPGRPQLPVFQQRQQFTETPGDSIRRGSIMGRYIIVGDEHGSHPGVLRAVDIFEWPAPTNTHEAGLSTPIAAIATRNASGWGFVHRSSLVYTAPSRSAWTPSRTNTRSRAARGHIVLDRTPTRIPRVRSPVSSGIASGSVRVCGSPASKKLCQNPAGTARPAQSKMRCNVALACTNSDCRQSRASAARNATAAPVACVAGKCRAHTSRHSASWSTGCQRVNVPPQSKITALIAISCMLTALACRQAPSGGFPHNPRVP